MEVEKGWGMGKRKVEMVENGLGWERWEKVG